MPLLDYLQELNMITILVRVLLAMVLGGVIGIERGKKKRPAGLRTHALVCIGSTIAMLTNLYLTEKFGSDPSRFGAQVISGIGFLGAGTIMVTGKNQIKGLTTAAGLWASACMGLAIGVGFYELALVGFIFILASTSILSRLNTYIQGKSNIVEVYIEVSKDVPIISVINQIKVAGFTILELEFNKRMMEGNTGVVILLDCAKGMTHEGVIEFLYSIDSIVIAEEI